MTRRDPFLKLCRLVVFRGDAPVYDELFHDGLNIIRGTNASGKTTIMDFLYHGLGGEEINWRDAALLCTHTVLEVEINGSKITLRRQVKPEKMLPMEIFWGQFDAAMKAAPDAWDSYSYASQGAKLSFSNALFRAMGIPEVRGALASRLTMYQLLRLMYVDQVTPYDQVFRFERFDNELLRDAVGALMCGFCDSGYYDLETLIRDRSNEHSVLRGSIRNAQNVLGGENTDPAALESRLQQKRTERQDAHDEIERVRNSVPRTVTKREDDKAQKAVTLVEHALRDVNDQVLRLRDQIQDLDVEIADSELFIAAIKSHLQALEDASTVRDTLGEATFDLCPACFSVVSEPSSPQSCTLCKTPRIPEKVDARIMRMRQELAQQLAESGHLQRSRTSKREALQAQLRLLLSKKEQHQLHYRQLALPALLGPETLQAELLRKIGYLDHEIEDLERRIQLAQRVQEMQRRADELEEEIKLLEERRTRFETEKHTREFESQALIVDLTTALLARDIEREESFKQVRSVAFSFAKNKVVADGRSNYAASSMVYLKNCFHVAILLASMERAFFRYPRFLMIDNVEDKGMEPARSHNFQRLVAQVSSASKVRHQIVISTMTIAPDLDVPAITVGEAYGDGKKSLKLNMAAAAR